MSKAIQRELVTCVKVALQLDWQLSHLDLRCSNNFADSFSVTGAVKGENKKLLPCLKASDWTTASDCTLMRVAAANFLSWHSVTHRLSASSHHASCPCSCSCEQQTPCHKQEPWWYARELSAHAVASWARAHNPAWHAETQTHFFLLRLSDHISKQHRRRRYRLPHCFAVWPLPDSKLHKNPIAAQVLVWNERQQTLTNTICHSLLDGRNVDPGVAHLDKRRSLCCFYTILIWLHTTEMYLLPPAACFSKDPSSFLLLVSPRPLQLMFPPWVSPISFFFPGLLLN